MKEQKGNSNCNIHLPTSDFTTIWETKYIGRPKNIEHFYHFLYKSTGLYSYHIPEKKLKIDITVYPLEGVEKIKDMRQLIGRTANPKQNSMTPRRLNSAIDENSSI